MTTIKCKACGKALNSEEKEDALATHEQYCNKCFLTKDPYELIDIIN